MNFNDKANLNFFNRTLEFKKYYKSKASLGRVDMFDNGVQYVKENTNLINNCLEYYKKCKNDYNSYLEKFNELLKEINDYSNLKVSKYLFKDIFAFISFEYEKSKELCIKNKNKFYLHVRCDYTSPTGSRHWYREEYFSPIEMLEMLNVIKNRDDYTKSIKYQRSLMTDSLRYDVLKRDGFKCKICGATAKEDGVKLHVDHIIPVSKGGKTEMSNLQTLCERCNEGKSNKY